MRRVTGSVAVAAMTLLGGCAHSAPPQEATAVQARGVVARRTSVVDCSTTYLVLATVSKCGSGGYTFGVAGE